MAVRRGRRAGSFLDHAWVWVLGAFVAVEVLYLALCAYVLPPATWDSLTYHLVVVGEWLHADRIVQSPLSVLANTSPLNGELMFLWVGALTGSDLIVDVAQLGFALLGAAAVVAIARTVGVSRSGSLVSGFLFFLTPVVLSQSSITYVDVIYPALFLAGYALLLRFLVADRPPRNRPGLTLVLAGSACGLAAGTKSIGVVYATVAVVVLGVNLLWRRRQGTPRGGAWVACSPRSSCRSPRSGRSGTSERGSSTGTPPIRTESSTQGSRSSGVSPSTTSSNRRPRSQTYPGH